MYRILGVFQPVSSMIIYMRASEEFVFAYSQSGGRDSFVFFFFFIGF